MPTKGGLLFRLSFAGCGLGLSFFGCLGGSFECSSSRAAGLSWAGHALGAPLGDAAALGGDVGV